MAPYPITTMSICTGASGLDLGLELAIGLPTIPVLYSEIEAYAAANLVRLMEENCLAKAPIWSDVHRLCCRRVRKYVGEALRGQPLGIFLGGIPCQPWSDAGKRLGKADVRDLWPPSLRAVKEYKPGIVFLENVPGFLKPGGLDRVAKDLESLGYRVAAGLFSSSEVGNSHRRIRVFVMGIAESYHEQWKRRARAQQEQIRGPGQRLDDSEGRTRRIREAEEWHGDLDVEWSSDDAGLADSNVEPRNAELRAQQGQRESAGAQDRSVPSTSGEGVGDARHRRRSKRLANAGREAGDQVIDDGQGVRAYDYMELPVHAPRPGDTDAWRRVLDIDERLAPAVKSDVHFLVDGMAHVMATRIDALRLCGNGVDPLAAAYAFTSLMACLRGG